MLSVLPSRRDADRAWAGFAEDVFVSSAGVAAVAVVVVVVVVAVSADADRSVDAREVRFWFVGMRLDCAKGWE